MGRVDRQGTNVVALALAGVLYACCPCAFALDPALDVSQYAHTAWTVRGGLSKGTVVAIAQTQDGYLWLGTEFGLLRFDGVRYVPWQPPAGRSLPSTYIRSLLVARDGRLWIGTSEGLASWKDGALARYAEFAGKSVSALLEDREGTVWAGGHAVPNGELCAIHGANIQCYGGDGSFGEYVDSMYEDRAGNLWVAGLTGLWQWKPGPPKVYRVPDRVLELTEDDHGALLITMLSGIRQLVNGKLEPYSLPSIRRRFEPRVLLRDRDAGLWIGTTDRGIVHVHQGRTDVFERSDGLSSDFIESIFEDREGTIWVATLDGLDRFRELAVPTISVKQGLSNATVKSVLAARDGSVWLATADGLNRWNHGRVTVYRKRSANASAGKGEPAPDNPRDVREITGSGLPDDAIESLFQDTQDRVWVATRLGVAFLENGQEENGRFTPVSAVSGEVHSIAGDRDGNIWISQDQNLFRLKDGKVVERIPWVQLGRQDGARTLATDPSGALWIGFRDGGVGYFKDGRVRTLYTAADGLGEAHVRDLQLDREGTLWASTEGGLSRLKDGRFVNLSGKNGLPCDSVHWALEDDDHSFWLYMACGLVRVTRSELDAWADAAGKDPGRQLQITVFDASDGVRSHSTTTGYSPSVAKSADGKLWFLPWDGVSVIDPRHLPLNTVPAPVHVEQITADRTHYELASGQTGNLRLPPLVRDLQIDYTAPSLVAAEKVLFRYKLEGFDRDWQQAGSRRQAFYTNLAPGNYRFRLSACNNSGVWNEAGTFLDFSIAPAYYQTTWFRFSCIAALMALLATLYQMRLRHVAHQFNMRMEERVAERNRIAQELHDSLLQGFLSASMHVHVAADGLPGDSPAKPILAKALEQMGRVIEEGRNALRGLRPSRTASRDLEHAFSLVQQELGPIAHSHVEFRVIVDGPQRPLRPLLRDEVYRIGREALINAFRHSQANHIEIELKYAPNQFRIIVRDDGAGIDPNVVTAGRDGHWGLSGMRERADQIGARFHVLSNASAGTEIELAVPGHLAFQDGLGRKLRWFG